MNIDLRDRDHLTREVVADAIKEAMASDVKILISRLQAAEMMKFCRSEIGGILEPAIERSAQEQLEQVFKHVPDIIGRFEVIL